MNMENRKLEPYFPLHKQLCSIDEPLLTDAEYDALAKIVAKSRIARTPLITGVGAEWERGFAKGNDFGVVHTLAQYPALAREVIARGFVLNK
jgi:hypothetical protein